MKNICEEDEMFIIQNETDLEQLCERNDKIIIYGAGMVAHTIVQYLLKNTYNEKLYCVAVKSQECNPEEILGVPVLQINELLKQGLDALFIIATLDNLHDEIENELKSYGCSKNAAVSSSFYYKLKRKQSDFTSDTFFVQRGLSGRLQKIEEELYYNREIGEVRKVNCETFSPYIGIHKGRDIVIVATGPSLNKYKPIPNAIHIGVNTAYKKQNITFDYYFIQDYTGKSVQTIEDIKEKSFEKFFGKYLECSYFHKFLGEKIEIPEQKALEAGAKRYYIDWPIESPIHRDIRYAPLMDYHSITFAAIQFALFCNPQKIYLAGCDCTENGYFNQDKQDGLIVDVVFRGYVALKKFVKIHYPETEIISINPVGLKGLFKDIYTDGL